MISECTYFGQKAYHEPTLLPNTPPTLQGNMSMAEIQGYGTHTFYEALYILSQSCVIEHDMTARQEYGRIYSPWDFFPATFFPLNMQVLLRTWV